MALFDSVKCFSYIWFRPYWSVSKSLDQSCAYSCDCLVLSFRVNESRQGFVYPIFVCLIFTVAVTCALLVILSSYVLCSYVIIRFGLILLCLLPCTATAENAIAVCTYPRKHYYIRYQSPNSPDRFSFTPLTPILNLHSPSSSQTRAVPMTNFLFVVSERRMQTTTYSFSNIGS